MKKKFAIKSLILILVLSLATGCAKIERGFTISVTGGVEDYVILGINSALMKSVGSDSGTTSMTDNESMKELEKEGYKLSEYKDSTYEGQKASRNIGTLDSLSTEGKALEEFNEIKEGDKIFKIEEKGFFSTTYSAKFKTNLLDEATKQATTSSGSEEEEAADEHEDMDVEVLVDEKDDEEDVNSEEIPTTGTENTVGAEDSDGVTTVTSEDEGEVTSVTTEDDNELVDKDTTEQILKSMDIKFVVNLPFGASSSKNNATTVDGRTLKWDLVKLGDSYVEFTFTVLNLTNVLLVAGGALLLLIILIVIIIAAAKKKKKAAITNDEVVPVVNADEKMSVLTPVNPTQPTEATLTPVETPVVPIKEPEPELATPSEPAPEEAKTE